LEHPIRAGRHGGLRLTGVPSGADKVHHRSYVCPAVR
jgi:hypothetical protein